MTHEEKKKEISIKDVKPVDAPYFSVASMAAQGTGNDFVLTFSRPIPLQSIATGQMNVDNLMNQAVVILSMSPQTAKDIALALSDAVAKHEKEYGVVITRYSKSVATSAKPTKAH